MRVEFLRAWEDGTWDTEVIEVPSITCDVDNGVDFDDEVTVTDNLICWANKILLPQEKYRKLALLAVYSTEPEEKDGAEEEES